MDPAELHQRVEQAFNTGDLDALTALYESDARMVHEDGSVAAGVDEIRAVWSEFVALGGQISMSTRYAVEAGDVALLSNAWTFTMDDAQVASSVTSEVARKQSDGSWRYVIDNPYGVPPSTTA